MALRRSPGPASSRGRWVRIAVSLPPDKRKLLQEASAEQGVSVAHLVRNCLFNGGAPQVPRVNREVWAALGQVAADLHELIAAVQAGQAPSIPVDLPRTLLQKVLELREDLLGRHADVP